MRNDAPLWFQSLVAALSILAIIAVTWVVYWIKEFIWAWRHPDEAELKRRLDAWLDSERQKQRRKK